MLTVSQPGVVVVDTEEDWRLRASNRSQSRVIFQQLSHQNKLLDKTLL